MLFTGFDFTDGPLQIADVIEGVEDAEDIDAVKCRALDKLLQHVVGVVAIPDQVLAAQQHLQFRLRHRRAEGAQTFPRIFFEEPEAGIEGRAAPDLQRPESHGVQLLGDGQHVLGAHPGREQALMPVAQRDLGHQQLLPRRRGHAELRARRLRNLDGA